MKKHKRDDFVGKNQKKALKIKKRQKGKSKTGENFRVPWSQYLQDLNNMRKKQKEERRNEAKRTIESMNR